MEECKSFGEKLSELMLENGYENFNGEPNTLKLSRDLQEAGFYITQGTLWYYIHKGNKPKREYVEWLALFFNVSFEYLDNPSVTARHFEYTGINKETGLSDKSIDVLKSIKSHNLTNRINEVVENENFKEFICLTSLKNDLKILFDRVEKTYEVVFTEGDKYKEPYKEYLKIFEEINDISEKYDKMYINIRWFLPYQKDKDFLSSFYDSDSFTYISLINELADLQPDIIRAVNLIDMRCKECLESLNSKEELIPAL